MARSRSTLALRFACFDAVLDINSRPYEYRGRYLLAIPSHQESSCHKLRCWAPPVQHRLQHFRANAMLEAFSSRSVRQYAMECSFTILIVLLMNSYSIIH
jgi:hypothetical protein